MLLYALICLSLSLAGVAGLQLMYMFYLDRIDRERKKRLRQLERQCKSLSRRLEHAEDTILELEMILDTPDSEHSDDEHWADLIDET
jgi:septal ring factor EnvC (AmiA/AmiB activator)